MANLSSSIGIVALTLLRWFSSAGMLVINKLCVQGFSFPYTVLLFQFAATLVAVAGAHYFNLITVEPLDLG